MVTMARDSPTFFDKVGECVGIICDAACTHRVKMQQGFVSIAIAVKAVEGAAMHLDPLAVVAPRAKDAIVRAHAKRAGRNLLRGRSTEAIEAATARELELEAQERERRRGIDAARAGRQAAAVGE
jgi:hypothetical protein